MTWIKKLTDEQVEEARELRKQGFEYRAIGERLGVSHQIIGRAPEKRSNQKQKMPDMRKTFFRKTKRQSAKNASHSASREATLEESARRYRDAYRDKCREKKLKDTYGITLAEYEATHENNAAYLRHLRTTGDGKLQVPGPYGHSAARGRSQARNGKRA